jgi:hypothetical protein
VTKKKLLSGKMSHTGKNKDSKGAIYNKKKGLFELTNALQGRI